MRQISRRNGFPACLLAVLVGAALLASGCASKPSARLNISPDQGRQAYSQHFPQAVFTRSPQGQLDIVMVQDGTENLPTAKPGAPLKAVSRPPLKQVVHVHVLWKSLLSKADHPSATNAVVDWYVFGDPASADAAVLHYEGAAFVSFNRSGELLKATIRNGSMKLKARHGSITDPLGASSLEGTIVAVRNTAEVETRLSRLEGLLAPQPSATPGPQAFNSFGPPVRRPIGP